MKVFRVLTEHNGSTIKDSGTTRTELIREEILYAAETIQRVWDAVGFMHLEPKRTIIEISEVAPAITILSPSISAKNPYFCVGDVETDNQERV